MTPDEARDRVQAIVDGMTLPVPWQARVHLSRHSFMDPRRRRPNVELEMRRPAVETAGQTYGGGIWGHAFTLEFVRDALYLEAIVQDTVDRIIRENSPWLEPASHP